MKEVTLHQEIVKVAHNLFERSGRVEGHDLDNWLEAERIVRTRHRQQEIEAKIPEKKMTLTKKERSNNNYINFSSSHFRTYCAFMK